MGSMNLKTESSSESFDMSEEDKKNLREVMGAVFGKKKCRVQNMVGFRVRDTRNVVSISESSDEGAPWNA